MNTTTLQLTRTLATQFELDFVSTFYQVAAHRRLLNPAVKGATLAEHTIITSEAAATITRVFQSHAYGDDRYRMPSTVYCHHASWDDDKKRLSAPCGIAATCEIYYDGEWDEGRYKAAHSLPLCGFHGNEYEDSYPGVTNWIGVANAPRRHETFDQEPPF